MVADITVIIPTYNRFFFLQRALKSVLAQTLQPKEIIIVDDGSSDATATIKELFPFITYIYQSNKGVSAARNAGIKKATTQWIAFLDDDDTWQSDKLQKQFHFHQQNPNFLWSYTQERWIKNNNEILIPKKFHKPKSNTFLDHFRYCNIAPSSVMIHKRIFEDVGVFDESFRVSEDFDLWLRILLKYPLGLVEEKLINKYAGHKNQLGFSKEVVYYRKKALQKHLQTVFHQEIRKILS